MHSLSALRIKWFFLTQCLLVSRVAVVCCIQCGLFRAIFQSWQINTFCLLILNFSHKKAPRDDVKRRGHPKIFPSQLEVKEWYAGQSCVELPWQPQMSCYPHPGECSPRPQSLGEEWSHQPLREEPSGESYHTTIYLHHSSELTGCYRLVSEAALVSLQG